MCNIMCWCVCVCVCVCVYGCMYDCIYLSMYEWMYVCVHVCVRACVCNPYYYHAHLLLGGFLCRFEEQIVLIGAGFRILVALRRTCTHKGTVSVFA